MCSIRSDKGKGAAAGAVAGVPGIGDDSAAAAGCAGSWPDGGAGAAGAIWAAGSASGVWAIAFAAHAKGNISMHREYHGDIRAQARGVNVGRPCTPPPPRGSFCSWFAFAEMVSPRPQGPARQQTAARHYDGLSDGFPDVHRRRLKGTGPQRAFRFVTNC